MSGAFPEAAAEAPGVASGVDMMAFRRSNQPPIVVEGRWNWDEEMRERIERFSASSDRPRQKGRLACVLYFPIYTVLLSFTTVYCTFL